MTSRHTHVVRARHTPLYATGVLVITFFAPGLKKGLNDLLEGTIKEKGIRGVVSSIIHGSIGTFEDHPYILSTAAVISVTGLVVWLIYWWRF